MSTEQRPLCVENYKEKDDKHNEDAIVLNKLDQYCSRIFTHHIVDELVHAGDIASSGENNLEERNL